MNKILKTGFRIKTLLGKTAEVEKFIDEEEQYTVYEVDYMKQVKNLIWLKKECLSSELYECHKELKQDPELVPLIIRAWQSLDITEWKDGTFGYITNCPPQDYDDLIKELSRKFMIVLEEHAKLGEEGYER